MQSELLDVLNMSIGDAGGRRLNYMIFHEGGNLASKQRRGRELG